eukprot:gene12190-2808_t
MAVLNNTESTALLASQKSEHLTGSRESINSFELNCTETFCVLSASREGHLPEPLSYIHMDRRTPIPAVLFLSLLSMIWILVLGAGTQNLLIYFSFAIWFTYGLAIFGVIVLRVRQPDLPRPIKLCRNETALQTGCAVGKTNYTYVSFCAVTS